MSPLEQNVVDAQSHIETLVDSLMTIGRLHRRKEFSALDEALVDAIAEVSTAREVLADILEQVEGMRRAAAPSQPAAAATPRPRKG